MTTTRPTGPTPWRTPLTSQRADVRSGRGWLPWVPWALAAGGVLTQIMFPLTDGGTFALTVLAVVLLSGAALAHALVTRGPRVALTLVALVGGGAFLGELIGVVSGLPFGDYRYTGTLGPQPLGVPVLVPLAWIMVAWPALLVARRLTVGRGRLVTALVAAWALTAWDVFLDPQMVAAGHWVWEHPTPSLPGVPGIPLTNYAGWLVVSLLLCAALDRCVPPGSDGVAVAVYLWTYFSSVLANAVFFGRPSVALVGAVAMGLVAVPLCVRLVRERGR